MVVKSISIILDDSIHERFKNVQQIPLRSVCIRELGVPIVTVMPSVLDGGAWRRWVGVYLHANSLKVQRSYRLSILVTEI